MAAKIAAAPASASHPCASANAAPEPTPAELQLYTSRLAAAYAASQAALVKWQEYDDELRRLGDLLTTLPDETSRPVTVPFGKYAFMPGKLVHTNEVLVLLGDNWYAERSAKQAFDISVRRREFIQEAIKKCQKDVEVLQAKVGVNPAFALDTAGVALNEEGLPIVDIREDIVPGAEKARPVPVKDAENDIVETSQACSVKDWENNYLRLFDKYEKEEAELHAADEEASEESEGDRRIGSSGSDASDTDEEEGTREEMRAEMERLRERMRAMQAGMEEATKFATGGADCPNSADSLALQDGPSSVASLGRKKTVTFSSTVAVAAPDPHPAVEEPLGRGPPEKRAAGASPQISRNMVSRDSDASESSEKIVGVVNWGHNMSELLIGVGTDSEQGELRKPSGTPRRDKASAAVPSVVGEIRERSNRSGVMSAMVVEKEKVEPVSESDVEDEMLMREIKTRHSQLRTNLVAELGGYSRTPEDATTEVVGYAEFDQQAEQDEPRPAKVSLFKATRSGNLMNL